MREQFVRNGVLPISPHRRWWRMASQVMGKLTSEPVASDVMVDGKRGGHSGHLETERKMGHPYLTVRSGGWGQFVLIEQKLIRLIWSDWAIYSLAYICLRLNEPLRPSEYVNSKYPKHFIDRYWFQYVSCESKIYRDVGNPNVSTMLLSQLSIMIYNIIYYNIIILLFDVI